MVAEGKAVMVTDAVTVPAEQPPEPGYEYVMIYVPAVEVEGVIAPELTSMVNPAGAE